MYRRNSTPRDRKPKLDYFSLPRPGTFSPARSSDFAVFTWLQAFKSRHFASRSLEPAQRQRLDLPARWKIKLPFRRSNKRPLNNIINSQGPSMTGIRISKALAVLAAALFATIVTINNITDYRTNFIFVQHVFMMDTTYPDNNIMYRAITAPALHHIGYLFIIALEMGTAILCWIGGVHLLRAIRAGSADFRRPRGWPFMA